MADKNDPAPRKDSRRAVALSEETIERIKRVMATAVLRGIKDYPQSVSAFISAAAEEKVARDAARFEDTAQTKLDSEP